MRYLCTILAIVLVSAALAQDDSAQNVRVPFDGYDLTWINGQNRQTHFPLTFTDKAGETVCTGLTFLDCYYNYDFSNPIDNTHLASATIGRSNEFTLNMASIGLETSYHNIVGRLSLQYGQLLSIVQDLDGTVSHGRNSSLNNLKFIREAAAGYHFNKWYGVNVEMGIFMSYIGLESYVMNENWCYQRSMSSDMTPFYFSGARVQLFPSRRLKQEIWLLNGWQSFNVWHQRPGLGSATYYRPTSDLQLVCNFYVGGQDNRDADIIRYHHDHSIVARYLKNGAAKGISQAAFSINNHYGFQTGGGVDPAANFMLGTSVANRLWFSRNRLALTLRGDFVSNPGGYLAFSPSLVAPNAYTQAVDAGTDLFVQQSTATFDIMPNEFVTFRLEYAHRKASVPYFAGPGGTTSSDGWQGTATTGWQPDLRKTEDRIMVAATFRL